MCFSIPWTVVIYCDTPPLNIWTISLWLKIEGLLFPHVVYFVYVFGPHCLIINTSADPPTYDSDGFSFFHYTDISIYL